MKKTIELPDTAKCAFVNYVYVDAEGDLTMEVQNLDSGDFAEARKQGVDNA